MQENTQDIFTKSVLDLQHELESFRNIQKSLSDAQARLAQAEQSWSASAKNQQQSLNDLIAVTKSTVNTTAQIVGKIDGLAGALIPVVKSMESVNFPLRLDKIDMAVSTQASTFLSFQGATERGFRDSQNKSDADTKQICDRVERIGSRSKFIIIILFVNMVLVVGLVLQQLGLHF